MENTRIQLTHLVGSSAKSFQWIDGPIPYPPTPTVTR